MLRSGHLDIVFCPVLVLWLITSSARLIPVGAIGNDLYAISVQNIRPVYPYRLSVFSTEIGHLPWKCRILIISGIFLFSFVFFLAYSTPLRMKTTGMKVIPNDVANTSLRQTLHIPRGEKIGGSSSDDVKAQGYGTDIPQRQTRRLRSYLYNPIPSGVGNLDFKILCEDVTKRTKQVNYYLTFPFLITLPM